VPVGDAKVRMHSIQLGSGWLVAAQPAKAPFAPRPLRLYALPFAQFFLTFSLHGGTLFFLEGTTQFFEKKNLTRVDGLET
jgi:hypothetical protein